MRRTCIVLVLALGLASCAHKADDPFVTGVKALRPSVVLLTMQVPAETGSAWDDAYATGFVVASGSWGSDILTVQHAIDHARNLHVTIENKRRVSGHIIAQNAQLDIAIVTTSSAVLPPVKLGDSSVLQPGESIGVMGYPIPDAFESEGLGLATSIDSGRISSFRKHALELNLPIVPGESGGPVFTEDGTVIGLAESRFDEERSIGFALPINEARPFLHTHAHGF